MIRKLALTCTLIAAMTLGGFSIADAQDATPTPACQSECGIAYPGGFGALNPTATPRPTPSPTSSAVVSADTVAATDGGSTGGNAIAFTGSESRVLGYAGAGLIGFGAIALVAARRKGEQAELD